MSTYDLLRSALTPPRKPKLQNSDGKGVKVGVTLDDAGEEGGDLMAQTTIADIKLSTAASILQWVETDNLGEKETSADRLFALMIGAADANQDGEITEDEQEVLDMVLEYAWDYLAGKGVEEDDLDVLLNDWDNDAAERVRDLVASVLPEGKEAEMDDIESFAFGEVTLDAAYKKKQVIRDGEKVFKQIRVSGTVRRTAAQKAATRKAQMKSHSGTAKARRSKSNKRRKQMGL